MDATALIRRFPARPEHVGPAGREVTAYARHHGVRDPDGVALAVSEAVTNAVLHAYAGAPAPGDVELVARRLAGDGLEVLVCDEGLGMVPRSDSPGLGVGLAVLASVADRVMVEGRRGGGTRVRMTFAVAG